MEKALKAGERLIALTAVAVATILLPFMIGVRVWEIYTRNVLNQPSALYGYMEKEAFLIFVFLALGYAYCRDGHVRVDVLRDRLSPKARAAIELLGAAFLILPFCLIVVTYGIERVASIAGLGMKSALAQGLPWAWVIQAALPLGVALFGLAAVIAMIRNARFLFAGIGGPAPDPRRQ